jgi:hypothetical protein
VLHHYQCALGIQAHDQFRRLRVERLSVVPVRAGASRRAFASSTANPAC